MVPIYVNNKPKMLLKMVPVDVNTLTQMVKIVVKYLAQTGTVNKMAQNGTIVSIIRPKMVPIYINKLAKNDTDVCK